MPRILKEVERKRIEKVADSITCDGCGREAPESQGSGEGPVNWGDCEVSCWMFNNKGDEDDQEIILCPNCFRGLKMALPIAKAMISQRAKAAE